MTVLCAFALLMAMGVSQASADQRTNGDDDKAKFVAPAALGSGFSGVDRITPARPAVRGLSSIANSAVRFAPAYGGGANISNAVELPSDGASGTVNAAGHSDDVYWFYLEAGATIDFSLNAAPGSNTELWLFPPDAVDIATSKAIWADDTHVFPTNPDYDWYTAPVSGFYYIDVYSGDTGSSAYTLDVTAYNDAPNDSFPGVVPSASPINGLLHSVRDANDAYRFLLQVGDKLSVSLTTLPSAWNSAAFDPDLYVYGPSANLVGRSAQDAPAPESVSIVATQTGNYVARAFAFDGSGLASLSWNVNPVRPAISRSPSASKVTYKRKKGKVKFTLKARMLDQFSLPVKSTRVYLQMSSNGRTWKNTYSLYTNSTGWATKTITAKTKSAKYYRWYRSATATNTSAQTSAQRVVIK
jgi:hypothetical protein